jgi:hypothetical protein
MEIWVHLFQRGNDEAVKVLYSELAQIKWILKCCVSPCWYSFNPHPSPPHTLHLNMLTASLFFIKYIIPPPFAELCLNLLDVNWIGTFPLSIFLSLFCVCLIADKKFLNLVSNSTWASVFQFGFKRCHLKWIAKRALCELKCT